MRRCGLAQAVLHLLWGCDDSGVAAIEFALLSTVFLILLAGVVDVGSLIYTMSKLDAAVSAGAQYAENNAALVAANPSGLSTDIGNVVNDTNGTGWATSAVDVNNGNDATGCYCPTGSPGNWSWGGAVSCQSACGGGIAGQFVTITASRNFTPMFPSFGFVQNGAISRSAIVETQ
ncbi:MAG: TadE/TadG family type IV pilus assembly protein [Stellaceae bacterium]